MLELLNFIKRKQNWEEKLVNAPYHIKISKDNDLWLFKYDQIKSDFSDPVVQDARGIIIDVSKMEIVCYPFSKFFNFMEMYAAPIDWETARVQEKVDGSIIKVWFYEGKWRISTNGVINAFAAECFNGQFSYGELVQKELDKYSLDGLDKAATHIFEFVSPYTQVVIPYPENKLYYLGSRINATGREYYDKQGFEGVKSYPLKTLDECIATVKNFPFTQEGFVVVDAKFNRIKIKGTAYLVAHRLSNNGALTTKRVIEMIMIGEQSEYLSYFPTATNYFEECQRKLNILFEKINSTIYRATELWNEVNHDRKSFALEVVNWELPFVAFLIPKNQIVTLEMVVESLTIDKILTLIEHY